MDNVSGESQAAGGSSIRKIALASLVGTTVEWYDFFLYGTAAALVFNRLFFPDFSELAGTLAAFATFAAGFLARPLGGVIFGHIGDRVGRKASLVMTMLVMGAATFFVGLLPSFEQIGVLAPLLLVLLRLLQGIGLGGEWGGAVLMAVEHAPDGRRGFYGSWPQVGVPAGLVLGTGVFAIFATLPDDQFFAWGWRVPFLLSIFLVGVGLFVRLRIMETPFFDRVRSSGEEARLPVVDLVRAYPGNVTLTLGARLVLDTCFYIFATFVLAYATGELGLPRSMVLTGLMIAAVAEIATIPIFGALSDRVGRRAVYMGGVAFLGLFAFPFFWLLGTGAPVAVWLALTLGLAGGHAAAYGPQAALYSELFDTRVRYSGATLGYQLSGMIAGGPAPFVATALVAYSGGAPWLVAAYMAFMAAISLLSAYAMAETFKSDLSAEPSGKRRPAAEGAGQRRPATSSNRKDGA